MSRSVGARARDVVAGTAVLLVLVAATRRAAAQDLRARATTSLYWVELQPVRQDTVSMERVVVEPDGSLTFEGRRVTCVPGLACTFYRVLPEESALAGTQDVSVTAWGLGLRGLSATGLVRGRFRLGGDFTWPRSDDAIDLVLGYAELQRGALRLRVGRQETLSGLGFWGYDGANARWAPLPSVAVEGYAGRSLARGLSEPHHQALRGLEDFIPDRNAYLFGGFLRARVGAVTTLGVRYQREIWSDRSGFLQERASLDAVTDRFHPLRVEGALDWDVAANRLGKSHVRLAYPLTDTGLFLEGTLRRYVPYFQLSTIWGFFSPVPYHEALLRAGFSPLPATSAQLSVGWRRYGDTHAQDFLSPLVDDGWRAEAVLASAFREGWTGEARYSIEWGAGAFLSAADAHVRWRAREGLELGVTGTAFQQILEFRVGEGRVWGGGLMAGLDLPARARLDAGAALYRHGPRSRATAEPWGQRRVWTVLGVPFGSDPGTEPDRRWRR